MSKPHGTKGEIYVWPLTDHPETTFTPGIELSISDADGRVPDPEFPRLTVGESRPYRRGYLVRFVGIDDRDAAEGIRDRYLLRPFNETSPLDEGEIFYHQLLGMTVVTKDGVEVGTIREVYGLKPAEMLDVSGPGGEKLIPFSRQIVVEWDVDERRMVIDPPEGLLDL